MTTQTAEFQEKYVLTSDANGISTYDAVGECVPSLGEIERFVTPRLKELGFVYNFLATGLSSAFCGYFVKMRKGARIFA